MIFSVVHMIPVQCNLYIFVVFGNKVFDSLHIKNCFLITLDHESTYTPGNYDELQGTWIFNLRFIDELNVSLLQYIYIDMCKQVGIHTHTHTKLNLMPHYCNNC